MVIYGPYLLLFKNILPSMSKNSKAAKKAAKAAIKAAIKNNAGNQPVNQGATGKTTKATTVVTDLADLATITQTPVKQVSLKATNVPKPLSLKPAIPKTPERPTPLTTSEDLEGYVLESELYPEGGVKFTKVITFIDGAWDIILCSKPGVEIPMGTKIKFTRGEYQKRPTVLNPVIIERDTPLAQLFIRLSNQPLEKVTSGEFAKKWLSVNHKTTDVEEQLVEFCKTHMGIKGIAGQIAKGVWAVEK